MMYPNKSWPKPWTPLLQNVFLLLVSLAIFFLCLCRDGATSNIVTGVKGVLFFVVYSYCISGSFGKIIHLGNLKCAEA